jgi:hypothetical protein
MTTGDEQMRIERWSPVLAALGLSACVTINIYFPAAAAEKAADKIIDEVWQLKNGVKVPADGQPKEAK